MSHFLRVNAIVLIVIFALGIAFASRASENGVGDPDNPLTPVEFNQKELVLMAVQGFIAPPGHWDPPYTIDPDGEIHVVPGTGSITYNFRTGDSAINIAGDHVEPAVTLYNLGQAGERSSRESRGLNTLACIGNRVRVLDGEAKGAEGWVIGKHGGAEHGPRQYSRNQQSERCGDQDPPSPGSHQRKGERQRELRLDAEQAEGDSSTDRPAVEIEQQQTEQPHGNQHITTEIDEKIDVQQRQEHHYPDQRPTPAS